MTATERPVTTHRIRQMKQEGQRIVMLTAYDALFGRLVDDEGIDIVLVGDSLSTLLAGAETTLSATLEQMLYHGRITRAGVRRALVVLDMPFMSYQVSIEEATRNAGRALQEAGVHAVKLEGGATMAPTVAALVEAGIPVMGHLGFTPQSVHQLGGYRVQGRDPEAVARLVADARALESAGAFSLVLDYDNGGVPHWDTAERYAPEVIRRLLDFGRSSQGDVVERFAGCRVDRGEGDAAALPADVFQ